MVGGDGGRVIKVVAKMGKRQRVFDVLKHCERSILLGYQAHRALELLEDYHAKLTRPQDKALRLAIERVIRIFKSRLFQALLEQQHQQQPNNDAAVPLPSTSTLYSLFPLFPECNPEVDNNAGTSTWKSAFSMHLAVRNS
ncbi:hypothetical protein M0802_009761 [Mischocyttarus mexicanus]|nr:hypothetical protein M0802_009761 [Mischocyttarus mexicanus]